MHDWDDLRFFLAVAREGSVTAASSRLGVNQSTVSRRINTFEAGIGVRLFDRHSSGFSLTLAGEDLLRHVVRMEEATQAIDRQLAGRDNELSGELRVTTSQVIVRYLLIPELADFQAQYPGIRVVFDVSNDLYNLSAREADIAIRATSGDVPDTLIGQSVGDIHFGVYGRKELLQHWQQGETELPWIGEDDDSLKPDWLPQGNVALLPSMRSNDVQVTLDLIQAGVGIGRLPVFAAVGERGLCKFGPAGDAANKSVWILRHADMRRVERIRVFSRFFSEVISRRLAAD